MPVLLGTSGWMYRHWRGRFYPDKLPQRQWLEYYAEQFDTVELNNAFYRLPSYEDFAGWRDRLPRGFVVALKASRFLTHIKRLREPAEPVARLLDHSAGLDDRLGPVLLQLPPTLQACPRRLDECLSAFGSRTRVAVEPRHDSWWTDEIRGILEQHGAALCWADNRGFPSTPLWRTADWGYVRFHEGRASPWPRYGRQALRSWANRIDEAFGADAEVYAYFNNDPDGAAIEDARRCAAELRDVGLTPTRTG
jgi:uncharacterized protein YecE (DUF72 family)